MLETIVLIVLVCVALALIGLVLIQQGKGADAGASFGGGASQTVFGGAGSGNFLTKTTWTLGIVFFICCLFLGYTARKHAENAGRFDFSGAPVSAESVPAAKSDVPQLPVDAGAPAQPQASDVPAPAEAAPATSSEAVPAAAAGDAAVTQPTE